MADLSEVFEALSKIMRPYSTELERKADNEEELYLDTRHILKNRKPLWFGAVQRKKNYVSYHLMPVYINPELLDSISPELKKRMQGKSCFNFTSVDAPLFDELALLTQAGFDHYRDRGFV